MGKKLASFEEKKKKTKSGEKRGGTEGEHKKPRLLRLRAAPSPSPRAPESPGQPSGGSIFRGGAVGGSAARSPCLGGNRLV